LPAIGDARVPKELCGKNGVLALQDGGILTGLEAFLIGTAGRTLFRVTCFTIEFFRWFHGRRFVDAVALTPKKLHFFIPSVHRAHFMSDTSASIVSKVPPSPMLRRTGWNYPLSLSELRRAGAHILNNAGVGYGNYVE
jgi:hypothetical protein